MQTITPLTFTQKGTLRKRPQYDKVTTERRAQLLSAIYEQGIPPKKAAALLNINYSTAKTIIQVYKQQGRVRRFE